MNEQFVQSASSEAVEAVLRAELAHGETVAETVIPILRHLIVAQDNSLFSDEILARVRGMLTDLANTLLDALSSASGSPAHGNHDPGRVDALIASLTAHGGVLAHLHAMALEWQLTERLQSRLALDPVVSPLMQAFVSSPKAATQQLAMNLLTAQARWCQAQRRMNLALLELPGELFHVALVCMAQTFGDEGDVVGLAGAALRETYNEATTRLGLAAQLVLGLGSGASAALSVAHAGVPLFLTALAVGSGQSRDVAVQSTHEAQVARLALSLRVAGLKVAAVEEQFLALHPEIVLPSGFERLSIDAAASILASGRYVG